MESRLHRSGRLADARLRRDSAVYLGGDVLVVLAAVWWAGLPLLWGSLFLLLLIATLAQQDLYRPRLTLQVLPQVPALASAPALALLGTSVVVLLQADGARQVAVAAALAAVGLPLVRACGYAAIRRRRRSPACRERALIVGAGRVGRDLARSLQSRPEHGLTPVGFIDRPLRIADGEGLPLPVLGAVDDLPRVLQEHRIMRLIVAYGAVPESEMVTLMRAAIAVDVEVHIVPRFFDVGLSHRGSSVDEVWGIPLHRVRRAALRRRSWVLKRGLDIALVSLGAVLAAPVLLAGALLARHASGGGPVLFRQTRIGQHGRPFELLKFRSLHAAHPGNTTWNVDAQPDLPWSARVLRQTSIDELPQLWNVLRGDMSLVGPRPERPVFVSTFAGQVPGYRDRHRLPVGMTGWAQVNGLRGDTSIAQRARFDNTYVESWSPWFDIVILFRTVGAVCRGAVAAFRRPPPAQVPAAENLVVSDEDVLRSS